MLLRSTFKIQPGQIVYQADGLLQGAAFGEATDRFSGLRYRKARSSQMQYQLRHQRCFAIAWGRPTEEVYGPRLLFGFIERAMEERGE